MMGSQALNAQRIAIETIGNNISNINTPGYSRERANMVTDTVTGTAGELHMGVTVSNIESLRSAMLDSQVQQALGNQGFADNTASLGSTVQDALGEQLGSTTSSTSASTVTTGSGPVQDALTNFFSAFQSLSGTPSDGTARQVVAQDAQTLTTAIGSAYQRVQSTQGQIATDAQTVVSQINQLSTTIASLNQQITQVESSSGTTANDLRDSREASIEQLAGLVNISSATQTNGTVTVSLADNPSVVLVSGVNSGGAGGTQSLSVSYNASASVPLTVSGSTTGTLGTGVPSAGSLGADLEVANNVIGSPASSGNTGILGALDTLANQLSTAVNNQSALGFDANGNAGTAFFTGSGALNLAVSSSVKNNPSLIAAGDGSGPLDGSNALAIANLQSQSSILPAFQTMVANLGQTVSTATTNQKTQDALTTQVQAQRNSVSGVSIDEEMTNLINYQQAYDASARFINTISNLYDTLINKTGS
jgi:flagellar hook-associated protein 1 FlgK